MNNYYIPNITPEGVEECIKTLPPETINLFVEDINTLRWNIDKTKCILKTKKEVKEVPDFLINNKVGYTDLLIILQSEDWTPKEEI